MTPQVQRTRYDRRDERLEQFLGDVDRRRGPRRFDDIYAEHEEAPMATYVRTVAERNPTLSPLFADILQRCVA